MKTIIKILAIFALLLAIPGSYKVEAAATIYKFRQEAAEMNFFTVDESGCVNTSVWVFAGEQLYSNARTQRNTEPAISLHIAQYDYCLGTVYRLYANQVIPKSAIKIDGGLNTATLTTTVEATNLFTGDLVPVSIDLTWTAASPMRREITHYHNNFAGYHLNESIRGAFRYAEVSGTLSDGTTNFISGAAGDARIYDLDIASISHSSE